MLNVLLFSLLGGLVSLSGALLLFRDKKQATKLALYATPLAAGVLLASAFTDLLPEAIEQGPTRTLLLAALLGMLAFFILERYVRVFHHHHEHKGKGKKGDQSQNSLIIIGDTLHNLLDGVAIGAAFLIDVPTGIVASIAVAAHEIPQEIGDFGLLLRNGMEKRKVIWVNVISALATTIAAVTVYAIGDGDSAFVPYLLAVTAGFFIYIAASDIIPQIHEHNAKKGDIRPWFLVAGAVLIMIVSPLAHQYIDAGHDHDHGVEASHSEIRDDHIYEQEQKDTHSHEHADEHDDHDASHGHSHD